VVFYSAGCGRGGTVGAHFAARFLEIMDGVRANRGLRRGKIGEVATKDAFEQIDGEALTLIVSQGSEPEFVFVTEEVVIADFSREK